MNEQVLETSMVKEFESSVNNILEFMQNAPKRLEELSNELSEVDLEISDVQHYIEFIGNDENTGFNAAEGFFLAKELQTLFKKRRKIKDETSIIESTFTRFSCAIGGVKKVESLKQGVDKSIRENTNKGYKPRIRVELFERIKHRVNIIE